MGVDRSRIEDKRGKRMFVRKKQNPVLQGMLAIVGAIEAVERIKAVFGGKRGWAVPRARGI